MFRVLLASLVVLVGSGSTWAQSDAVSGATDRYCNPVQRFFGYSEADYQADLDAALASLSREEQLAALASANASCPAASTAIATNVTAVSLGVTVDASGQTQVPSPDA